MQPAVPLVLAIAALGLAGCGDDDRAAWQGPPRPFASDGTLPLERFADYLATVDEPWEHSAVGLATAYALPVVQASGRLQAAFPAGNPEGADTVVVTVDRLFDDSVRELRFVLSLERHGDGSFGVREARWEQRCHSGRGHQTWSPAPCV